MKQKNIIRRRRMLEKTGLTAITQWRLERAGLFPRRVRLNPEAGNTGAVGWYEDEVDEWIHSRIRVAGRTAMPVIDVDAQNGRAA